MKPLNFLLILAVVVVLLTGIFFIQYYFNYKNNQCLSSPLVYGAKQLTEIYGFEFIGTGFFKVPLGMQSPSIHFSSTNISIKK